MSQMNTHKGCIACLQSILGGFIPALKNVSLVAFFASGDDDKAFTTSFDDETTTSQ